MLHDSFRFCPSCGQNKHVHPVTFGHFLHDATHFFTHADKGIFPLLKNLAIRPGVVGREYLEGKRKKYMSPLNFLLIVLGLFVFTLTTFKTFQRTTDFNNVRASVRQIPDEETRERRLAKVNRAERATQFITKYSNIVNLFFATPLISLIFYLFYKSRRVRFFEHLAFNFYLSGFVLLIFIILISPLIKLIDSTRFYLIAIGLFLLIELIYRAQAYYQFFNEKGRKPYLKALLVSVLAILLWSIVSRTLITLYINTGFYLDKG